MRRGEVFLVDLEPTRGAEANKLRPAVLVSNDAANRAAERNRRGVVTVVPITSNTARVYAFQTLIGAGDGGLTADSKAQAEQVRSIDRARLGQRLGRLSPDTLRRLDDALRVHLAL
jgi:mRNA interferase MazF